MGHWQECASRAEPVKPGPHRRRRHTWLSRGSATGESAGHGVDRRPHHARRQRQPRIPPKILDPLLTSCHAILVGLAEHRRVPGCKQSRTRDLLQWLRDRDEQVLLFARDLSVPFANNQAANAAEPQRRLCRRAAGWRDGWQLPSRTRRARR